ncbi:MAG TPA: hypothetical protein DDW50_12480 [Firmicutes bacterium]|nr:hypothetical protein [Bacillota bacterium]
MCYCLGRSQYRSFALAMEGLDGMARNRFGKIYEQLTKSQIRGLTNGPGKLCGALWIDKSFNGVDLCSNQIYVEEGGNEAFNTISAKRIGVDRAEEAKDYPWGFYIAGNEYVSVK